MRLLSSENAYELWSKIVSTTANQLESRETGGPRENPSYLKWSEFRSPIFCRLLSSFSLSPFPLCFLFSLSSSFFLFTFSYFLFSFFLWRLLIPFFFSPCFPLFSIISFVRFSIFYFLHISLQKYQCCSLKLSTSPILSSTAILWVFPFPTPLFCVFENPAQ